MELDDLLCTMAATLLSGKPSPLAKEEVKIALHEAQYIWDTHIEME